MKPGCAHLVYGPIASGKSTFAIQIAKERNAIRFAIDDWMHELFGDDMPEALDMAWALERVDRCRSVIWATSRQILSSGRDVILELGLMREADRQTARAQVAAAGFECQFHFVDAPREVRLERLNRRNEAKGETFAFKITPAMFEAVEMRFERPPP